MEALTGVPSSEVLGRRITEVARESRPLRDLVAHWPLERVLAGETAMAGDQLHVLPGGARHYCDWHFPVRDAGGATVFGLAVARDVTTRHEVERRAAELDAVFRALNDRCVRVDTDGLIIRLLGGYPAYVSPDQVEGKRVRDILDSQDASSVEAALAQLRVGGAPVTVEYDVIRADGKHHLEARLVPFLEREAIAVFVTSPTGIAPRRRFATAKSDCAPRRRWRRWVAWRAGWRTTSTTCSRWCSTCAELAVRLCAESSRPRRPRTGEMRSAVERGASLTQQLLAFSRSSRRAARVPSDALRAPRCDTMLRRLIGEHVELVTRARPGPPGGCASDRRADRAGAPEPGRQRARRDRRAGWTHPRARNVARSLPGHARTAARTCRYVTLHAS